MKILKKLHELYTNARTGTTPEQRARQDYLDTVINYRAQEPRDWFQGFDYVFQVNIDKMFVFHMFPELVYPEYFYPKLPSGKCAEYAWFTGMETLSGIFLISSSIYNEERVYVATNDPLMAAEIKLKTS